MTDEKQILATATALAADLEKKICDRDTLNVQIMELEKNIHNLNVMLLRNKLVTEGKRLTAVGLTEAVRTVLRRHARPITPADMKSALNILGFDLSRFKNPSAVIHNTLSRMAKAGELRYHAGNKTYALLPNYHDAGPSGSG